MEKKPSWNINTDSAFIINNIAADKLETQKSLISRNIPVSESEEILTSKTVYNSICWISQKLCN